MERSQAGGEDYSESRQSEVYSEPFLSISLESGPLGVRRGKKNRDQKDNEGQQQLHSVDIAVGED